MRPFIISIWDLYLSFEFLYMIYVGNCSHLNKNTPFLYLHAIWPCWAILDLFCYLPHDANVFVSLNIFSTLYHYVVSLLMFLWCQCICEFKHLQYFISLCFPFNVSILDLNITYIYLNLSNATHRLNRYIDHSP